MYAIRAGRAFDGESFLAEGATVLVDGGRIAGVEPASFDVPGDCPVTDHPDATILPGLIDTHVHLVTDSGPMALDRVEGYSEQEVDDVVTEALRRSLAAGVTMVRDLGDRGFNVVERRDRQRAADDGLPWIVASGPPITTRGGHCWYLRGEVEGRQDLERAIRERVERGVDVVKIMTSGGMATANTDIFAPQFSDDDLRFLVDGAHAAGLPVAAHAHAARAIDQVLPLGVQTIEHASYLTRLGDEVNPGLAAFDSGVATDEQLEALAASGTLVCPTMGGLNDKMFDNAPQHMKQMLAQANVTAQEVVAKRMSLLHRMAGAGVRFVGGTDAGIVPPKAHGANASPIIELGRVLGPSGSLTASTRTAAEICGYGRSKGRLRPGYDADLVVVAGDLSGDLEGLREVRQVVLRGREVTAAGRPSPG